MTDIVKERWEAYQSLKALGEAREAGIGKRDYGPYFKGKYTVEENVAASFEEVADIYVRAIKFHKVERPYNESERSRLKIALAECWLALQAMQDAPEVESPGCPFAFDGVDEVPGMPPHRGPPAWDD